MLPAVFSQYSPIYLLSQYSPIYLLSQYSPITYSHSTHPYTYDIAVYSPPTHSGNAIACKDASCYVGTSFHIGVTQHSYFPVQQSVLKQENTTPNSMTRCRWLTAQSSWARRWPTWIALCKISTPSRMILRWCEQTNLNPQSMNYRLSVSFSPDFT